MEHWALTSFLCVVLIIQSFARENFTGAIDDNTAKDQSTSHSDGPTDTNLNVEEHINYINRHKLHVLEENEIFGTPDDFKLSVSEAKGRALTSDLVADDDQDSENNDLDIENNDLERNDLELTSENFDLDRENGDLDAENNDLDRNDVPSDNIGTNFDPNQKQDRHMESLSVERPSHGNNADVDKDVENVDLTGFMPSSNPLDLKSLNQTINKTAGDSSDGNLSSGLNETQGLNDTMNNKSNSTRNATEADIKRNIMSDQEYHAQPKMHSTTLPSTTSEATTLPSTTQQHTLKNEDIMQSLGIHYVKNFINFLRAPSQKMAHKSHQYFVNALRFQPNW